MELNNKIWHVTWVTRNSRISERMILARVKLENPVTLTDEMRNIVAESIKLKIKEESIKIYALNVLMDHVHIIIQSSETELEEIVRKLKGYSSYQISKTLGYTSKGQGKQTKIWATSFSKTLIRDKKHLLESINYIKNNHLKHNVTPCKALLFFSQSPIK